MNSQRWFSGRVVLAAGLLLVGSTIADAQQFIVLQHGFRSTADTWEEAANRLEHDFVVNTRRYNTSYTSSFADQEATFNAYRAADELPSNTIGVAHSNGSRVLRLSAQHGNSFSGIITVGGTHGGVPLVASAANGELTTMYWFLAPTVRAPLDYYTQYPYDPTAESMYWAARDPVMNVYWLISGLEVGASVSPFLGWPVLSEMPEPLATTAEEESNVSVRVGVTSSVDQSLLGLAAHGLYPAAWGYVSDQQTDAIILGVAFYDYLTFFLDETQPHYWELYEGRYLWVEMAAATYNLDVFWCNAIGALDYDGCHANDGILPANLQLYPNASANQEILVRLIKRKRIRKSFIRC